MKTTTKRISLLFWLTIVALHLLVSALPAPGTCAPKLNNADWQILPLSQSSRVKGARLTELQTGSLINASHGVLVVAQSGLSNPVIGLVRMLPAPESNAGSSISDNILANIQESQTARASSGFLQASRQWTATDYFDTYTNMTPAQYASHMSAIDFSNPVTIETFQPGTQVTQYQPAFVWDGNQLVANVRVGSYFTDSETPLNTLGLYTSGQAARTFEITNPTPVLSSTAADTIDTWSMSQYNWSISVQGGGKQFFIPRPFNTSNLIPKGQ